LVRLRLAADFAGDVEADGVVGDEVVAQAEEQEAAGAARRMD